MREQIRILAINFSSIFSANAISRLLAFVYFTQLARYLGNSETGIYGYLFVFIGFGNIIADFGINRMLIRDVARDHGLAQSYLDQIVPLRLLLSIVSFALFYCILMFIQSDPAITRIAPIALLSIFPYSLALTFDGVLRAQEKMRFSAMASILFESSKLITLFLVIHFDLGLSGTFWMLLTSFLLYVTTLYLFLKHHGILIHLSWVGKNWRNILALSLPFALLSVLELIHGRLDIVLLKELLNDSAQVGNYFIAHRLMDVILILPAACNIVLLPRFSRQYADGQRIKFEYQRFLALLFVAGILVAGFVFLIGEWIIVFAFGSEYAVAANVLRILTISLFFFFIHYANVTFLAASHLQWKIFILSLIQVGTNIGANFLFIPRWGMYGAAWACNVSIALGFFMFSALVWRHLSSFSGIVHVQSR